MHSNRQGQKHPKWQKKIDELKNKKSDTGIQDKKIIKLLNQLAKHSAILLGEMVTTPISQIEYGNLDTESSGKKMTANVLSKEKVKGTPPQDEPKIWKEVSKRRNESGSHSFYVQGHLLNENMGGPGRSYNLSPITRKANSDHLHMAEKELKEELNKGKVFTYSVTVLKADHDERAITKQLKKAKNKDETDNKKLKLLKYEEENLTSGFNFNYTELAYDGKSKQWVKKDKSPKIEGGDKVPNILPEGDFNYKD